MAEMKYGSFNSLNKNAPSVQDVNVITLHDAVESVGCGKFQIRTMFLLGVLTMAEALELMLLSILAPTLKCAWNLTDYQIASITTAVFVGMMIGSPLIGTLSDKRGRKTGLYTAAIISLVFGLLSAFSPSYIWLLILRGLAGLGLSCIPLCSATFCEYLPVQWRAKMILIMFFFWSFGSVFEAVLGLLVIDSLGWRWFLVFTAFPFVFFLLLAPKFFPESSRYYLASGRPEKALDVLALIATQNQKELPEGRIQEETHENRGRIQDLFTPELRLSTVLLVILSFLLIITYYGLAFFSTVLFSKEGNSQDIVHTNFSNQTVNLTASCIGLTTSGYVSLIVTAFAEFPGTIMAILLVDIIGRKKTIALQSFILALSIASLFLTPLGSVSMTVAVFVGRAMGCGAFDVLYIFTPEIYPTHVRVLGAGVCNSAGRIGAMLAPVIAQVASSSSLNIPIGIFSTLSLAAAIVALLIPIETTGVDRG